MSDTNTPEINAEEKFNTELAIIEKGSLTVVEKSKALEIVDAESMKRSVDIERELKAGKKSMVDHFKPFKKALDDKHKNATAKEKEKLKPFVDEIASIQSRRDKYSVELRERLRIEQEERDKKDAAERKRQLTVIQKALDKEMEQAGNLDAQVDTILNKLETPDLPETEAEVLRSNLTVLQAKQQAITDSIATKARKAEEVVSAPPVAPPIAQPKIAGLVQKKEWTVTVLDIKELCKAIGEGTVSTDVITPNMAKLKSAASSGVKLPGCHVTSDMKSHTRK